MTVEVLLSEGPIQGCEDPLTVEEVVSDSGGAEDAETRLTVGLDAY